MNSKYVVQVEEQLQMVTRTIQCGTLTIKSEVILSLFK